MFNAFKERKPWVALIIALIDPVVAMCYLNRGKLAFVYSIVLYPLSFWFLVTTYFYGSSFGHIASAWVPRIIAMVHCFFIAKARLPLEHFKWYTRWYSLLLLFVLPSILALGFRTFLYEPFDIPSSAMASTIIKGDYIFVSKSTYGYSRYSFPLALPIFKGRIWPTKPERGDVVVFRPSEAQTAFIKRLIGLPGDHIQIKGAILYINEKAIPKEYVDDWIDTDRMPPFALKRYKETLPEGKSYYVLSERPNDPVENTHVYVVPEGHYFMLGDNRDNSRDSRYAHPVGFVPEENLIGKAVSIEGNTRTHQFLHKQIQ